MNLSLLNMFLTTKMYLLQAIMLKGTFIQGRPLTDRGITSTHYWRHVQHEFCYADMSCHGKVYCSFADFNKTSSVFLISGNELASQEWVSNLIYGALHETTLSDAELKLSHLVYFFFRSSTHLYFTIFFALTTEIYPRLFLLQVNKYQIK